MPDTRPRALDLFCGASGASMGLYQAGYDVTGVDIVDQPRYPFPFWQADALEFPLDGYDLIWASPPCQAYSVAANVHRNRGKQYPDLISATRAALIESDADWVIENVGGAPLLPPCLRLCGTMFGLKVFRHRFFESSRMLMAPEHPTHNGKRIGEGYFSVAGGAGRWKNWGGVQRDVNKGSAAEWRGAMGIPWMTRKQLTQSIPPAYSCFIGRRILEVDNQ